ncbi:DUF3649 domain-containing protein [Castellaniella defragrans]|uniref:DUF3649 domain-containing protein n=1 Tax=Castellaniella defragrans TaxID=75697 RepID=UPI0023F24FAB|nr:DUF3649 domain-containing protein [Castellaniella defragrans]
MTRIPLPVISRVVAAVCGGYALAALLSVAALAAPLAGSEAAFLGMMLSFLCHAGAVVWVFAVRSARRAWAGLLVAACVLLPLAWSAWPVGGAS